MNRAILFDEAVISSWLCGKPKIHCMSVKVCLTGFVSFNALW